MSGLRFFLTLFLTVALDLSVPIPSESHYTVVEEFEEATHRARSRRIQRQARETTVRSERAIVRREPLQLKAPAPVRRPVLVVLVPKLPAPFAESPPSPEDH